MPETNIIVVIEQRKGPVGDSVTVIDTVRHTSTVRAIVENWAARNGGARSIAGLSASVEGARVYAVFSTLED